MWGKGEYTTEDGLRTQRRSKEDKEREGFGPGSMKGKSIDIEM